MKKAASLAHSSNNHMNTFLKTILIPWFAEVMDVHLQFYYNTQNIKSHEGTKFNKISTFNASSRTFFSETDFFFFLLQLVQVVKNTVTTSLVWILGLSHAKAIGFYLPV